MKLLKNISFLIVIIFIMSLMVGCRLAPSTEKWYLSSYKKSMVFIGGLEQEVGFAQASPAYPFASADFDTVRIAMGEDGGFSFTAWDGEEVIGTYTYEHVGNYTNVYFTCESGETFSGSCMAKLNGDKYLVFIYKDVTYTFYHMRRDRGPTLDEIVETVKNGEADNLHKVTVTKQEDCFIAQFSEMVSYKIASDTLVYAIEINADGSYTILDAVREGEAMSTYNDSSNYIVLYYIDNYQ